MENLITKMEKSTNYIDVSWFVHKHCDPSWHLDYHKLTVHNIMLILSGSCTFCVNGNIFVASQGEFTYMSPGTYRSASTTGFDCIAINFDSDIELFDGFVLGDFYLDNDLLSLLYDYESVLYETTPYKKLKREGLIRLIFSRLQELHTLSCTAPYILLIKNYLSLHYKEPLSITAIAANVGLSPNYCGSVFKHSEGMSIKHYLNTLRVNKSKRLLADLDTPISSAAHQVGFSDEYYFSKIFKSITGIPPRKWQKLHGNSYSPSLRNSEGLMP